jgi:23S rRNA (guanosine2251-2'-O)-methyltransferase
VNRRRQTKREDDVVCGVNAVGQLLKSAPERVTGLWMEVARQDDRVHTLAERAQAHGIAVQRARSAKLDEMADGVTHQGVVARCRPIPVLQWRDVLSRFESELPPLLLALDGVEDPHNLGACIRTAAGAGVDTVIVPKNRGTAVNATVRRVASGATELVNTVPVSNLARALEQLAELDYAVVGLAGEASVPLYDVDLSGRVVLVAGAEGRGLRSLTRERCTALAHIPMESRLESLNVSVAVGIALFTARRALGL